MIHWQASGFTVDTPENTEGEPPALVLSVRANIAIIFRFIVAMTIADIECENGVMLKNISVPACATRADVRSVARCLSFLGLERSR